MIAAVAPFVPKRYLQLLAMSFVLFNFTACTTAPTSANPDSTTPTAGKDVILPPTVAETSGLACLEDGSFLTINDSGHSATVYHINVQGKVLQQFTMDATNRDWEAMTIHQGELWLGDIGNNSGLRTGGDLYHSPLPLLPDREAEQDAHKIASAFTSFVYPDLPATPLQVYQHDFDAEALVSANGQLYLFNKAWQSDHSTVYQLTPGPSSTSARLAARINGLPGVITDGAFSEQHQRFVLTGYAKFQKNMLSLALYDDYQAFLAVLDPKFNLLQVIPLAQTGQLEAICIDAQQQVWLTQEQSKRRPALLWRWGSMQQLLAPMVNE